MKKYLSTGIVFLLAFLLTSCVNYYRPSPSSDLAYEGWSHSIDTNPGKWKVGASNWFLYGASNTPELIYKDGHAVNAMSTMMVKVSNCLTNIKVKGSFKVQIFGTDQSNSLFLYGSNAAVRAISVQTRGNTLYLTQSEDAPQDIGCVIVRIGIRNLNNLNQMGSGSIEGRVIRSNHLCISSCGSGHIYLQGVMNVASIISTDKGYINIFGAVTPNLMVATSGAGSVNVCGNVGIRRITHHGCGNINIIGANSDGLTICADGKGKIGINGQVNINKIDARDQVCVYAYYVNGGDTLNVYTTDYARVGLAGCMRNLYVDAGRGSRFEGHYLYTNDAYVRAHDGAHINVMAANKVFAAATQDGSVYFFGSPNILTQFYRENGVIMPIGSRRKPRCGYCPYYQNASVYKDHI